MKMRMSYTMEILLPTRQAVRYPSEIQCKNLTAYVPQGQENVCRALNLSFKLELPKR